MDIKTTLFELSNNAGIGCVRDAADTAAEILGKYCTVTRFDNMSILGEIKGESDYSILLDAHIDEVGFIVTHISDDGFLTVAKCGGIDLRHLPTKAVTIHSKEKISGVFSSIPPHLSKGDDLSDDITDYKDIVSVGDFVTFNVTATALGGTSVTGKSFDDRAGVCVLLELASRLADKKPPVTVKFLLSDAEELGLRGAGIATYNLNPDEAIAIDVSFGNGPDISPYDCGILGDGAMIGISPILHRPISDKLIAVAKENGIKYQTEVMGGKTSTNADVISIVKGGIKTGLVSIPLRNMHTDCEILDINDINSVCDLLLKYIMSGGVQNA